MTSSMNDEKFVSPRPGCAASGASPTHLLGGGTEYVGSDTAPCSWQVPD